MPNAPTARRGSSSSRPSPGRCRVLLHDPWVLLLLLLVPFVLRLGARQASQTLRYPVRDALRAVGTGRRSRWQWVLPALRALALVLLIIALARPQLGKAATKVTTEGIDIMLAVDVSGSMLAEDFQVNGGRAN